MRNDRMAIPPVGWRVPYVIIHGEPGRPLINSVRRPEEVLFEVQDRRIHLQETIPSNISLDATIRPNDSYYIMKIIVPVLTRCFSLTGVNVIHWYTEMPKSGVLLNRSNHAIMSSMPRKKGKMLKPIGHQGIIPQYFINKRCSGCELSVIADANGPPLCITCTQNPQKSVLFISKKIREIDLNRIQVNDVCLSCAENSLMCRSLDCPLLYTRLRTDKEMYSLDYLMEIIKMF